MAACSKDELQYIINHVVLPPRLPDQSEDVALVQTAEKALLNELLSVLRRFLPHCAPESTAAWSIVQRMLSCCITAKLLGDLSEHLLTEAVSAMEPGDVFPVRIRAQNAAIIFRRLGDVVSLECFELSPRSADVVGCKGGLRRPFPAYAVAVARNVATESTFCRELFTMLEKLDTEVVQEMMPKSRKAGREWSEFRDTCHPGLISELVMASVAAVGEPTQTLQLQKRIRDDVIWGNSLLPWRRSTLWLMLRVAIHTTLLRSMDLAQAHAEFKNFTAYFLINLLKLTADLGTPLDICKALQVKIARRLVKLGTSVRPFVLEAATLSMNDATEQQGTVWQEIQQKDAQQGAHVDVTTLEQDTSLTLVNSRAALDLALCETKQVPQSAASIPTSSYCEWLTYDSDELPCVNEAIVSSSERLYALTQYEHWVGHSSSAWLVTALVQPNARHCTSIRRSAECYQRLALASYSESPEQLSLMLLTLGDLWYALDRIAGALLPLLHHYSPEVSPELFDVLLLPKMEQMQRLQRLQLHIEARHQSTQTRSPSMFADPSANDCDCFAYKYFEQSEDHQKLLQTIRAEASTRKEEKKQEWRRKSDQYTTLTKEKNGLTCTTRIDYRGGTVHDDGNCRKCDLSHAIESLSIAIFEWPLPENEVLSSLAVFYLRCPEVVIAWQALTWTLVHDLGRPSDTDRDTPAANLLTYNGLSSYHTSGGARLMLASATKSITASHYRGSSFPITWEKVFSKNALRWALYDSGDSCWVHQQQEPPSFTLRCRLQLPDGPYQNLQYAVDTTSHSQNQVLAAQTECSSDLSIHEYVAFGSLRADGEKTQWPNICRELRATSLSWNTESVCCLIKQSAWQACSIGTTTLRTAHKVFESTEFTTDLLSNLEIMLDSIQANRQCLHTMEVVIVLALRALSLAVQLHHADRCFDLLRQCRSTVSVWTYAMEDLLRLATDPQEIAAVQCGLLKSATLCKLTFDVDACHHSRALTTSDDLLYWAMASMTIQNNTPGRQSSLPRSLRLALLRDAKLSQCYNIQLHEMTDNRGLDRAISRIWSAFQSSDGIWERHVQCDAQWMYKKTLAGSQVEPQKVFYNVLSGELLVDGRPLGLLPREYTSHAVFTRVFGAQILRVSTSDMTGMQYMTAAEEYGYRFYFSLRGADLIIRAKTASTVLELISHENFMGDFPMRFVEDCVHWLDLTTSVVEFRQFDQRWTTDVNNWRLAYQPHGVSHLQNKEHQLVDVRSRTCQNTLDVFGKLETLMFTHTTRSAGGALHVSLPRLGFHFVRHDNGELECQELRKIVDRDQSIGTLIGLKNRLVLCARGDRSRELDRLVLVPEGSISTSTDGPHIAVQVATKGRNVHCFRFRHDSILKRLEGDGSVVSRLYQAYLHALTSFILPDPLTGSLGMEQSVRILEEQIFRCHRPLRSTEMDMLNLIACLTPRRVFYPTHLQAMQQITWHRDISPLFQNGAFADIAQRIYAHSQQFIKFYADQQPVPALVSRGDGHLLERARARQSKFMSFDYGGNECAAQPDRNYNARDLDRDSEKLGRVYSMSSFVGSWTGDMTVVADLVPIWTSWEVVAGFGGVFDFSQPVAELMDLNVSISWGSLHSFCRTSTRENSLYKLLFLFAQISYGPRPPSPNDLKTLLAFATNQSLHSLPEFPNYGSFELRNGSAVDVLKLRTKIKACVKAFEISRRNLTAAERQQEHSDYQRLSSANIETAVSFYQSQWPCRRPTQIVKSSVKWLDVGQVKSSTESLFAEWYKNLECRQHLGVIRGVVDSTMTSSIEFPFVKMTWQRMVVIPQVVSVATPRTMSYLMEATSPDAPSLPSVPQYKQPMKALEINPSLRSLVTDFGANTDRLEKPLRSQYKMDLLGSLDALEQHLEAVWPHQMAPSSSARVSTWFDTCLMHFEMEFDLLCSHLQPKQPIDQLLKAAGLWPRLCVRDLFALIASISCANIPEVWKDSIIAVGTGITALQRTRRLVLAAEKGDTLSFFQEMANPGQSGWTAYEKPDWLLIEIENDLLIRPVQVKVAMEMIAPSSSSNTLMQLNMGEGKSSVITPLIAATLADKSRLVRVVVLRSLSRQMRDTLTQRLGGLVKRPVYFMPFSRKTSIDKAAVGEMQSMYADCMAKGGVIIAHPEHILSFKLMGVERMASGDRDLGLELMKAQAWLEDHCRDVLDESDEILDVKFQLIYTLGTQRNMDGQPDRWLMMQGVFDIVQSQAERLQAQHPRTIEIEKRRLGSFPSIRLLSVEARNSLVSAIAENICESKLAGLVISALPTALQEVVARFISFEDVGIADCKTIQSYFTNDEAYLKKLLLIRGLIAHGILLHALHDKRWSVNYGLHLTRCLFAVPYRAKGVPAPTAEFGHPDVAIALTCLSYYYTGLSDEQIMVSLELLQKADDPSREYGLWMVEDDSFPRNLRSWNAVNLEDRRQCNEVLFPALRFNKKVADFFMTNVVFPKEGKEFEQKLSTSGWDIPARPQSKHITTGFSGTNDNRFLLPSSISQHDLPDLQHTSGKVLELLLRPENLSYTCAKSSKGCQMSSQELLECIVRVDSTIRVLIDVGAQILDLANDEVITQWLALERNADAGVFFSSDDHAMILTRDGKMEALLTSSFVNRMDRCVVYLDDVHTRGTDLKLPLTARAAVTLGPRLTKDRLVQACMRLRQLGQGQSLMYFASPEVHHDIEATSPASPTGGYNGRNVIEWSLVQSCRQIERNQPLQVVQGLNYHQRQGLLDTLKQQLFAVDNEEEISADDFGEEIIEREAQSLHHLYAPDAMRGQRDYSDLVKISRSKPDRAVQELIELWDRIDPHAFRNANMHEELEREVGHEVEQETQIERPPRATPEKRKVDPNLAAFIRTGTLSAADSFPSAFTGVLAKSSTNRLLRTGPWQCLRVTSDFVRTIKVNQSTGKQIAFNDDYLRPVHWLLVSKFNSARDVVVIISQYEVNRCIDLIQAASSAVTLVSYEPRVTRSMPSLESSPMRYPPEATSTWAALDEGVRQVLHLFAGQLYFTTFEEYQLFLKSLASADAAPLGFIREWVGIRRKGQNYLPTHVGQVTSGRVLQREMFETGDEGAAVAGEK